MKLYEYIYVCLSLGCVVGVCLIGAAASLLGLTRLDNWCAKQLAD